MIVYAESSAILAWLVREWRAGEVRKVLAKAATVFTSDLTLIECDRCFIRALAHGEIEENDATARRSLLEAAAAHWILLRIDRAVVERSRRPFPFEPVRSLDAIHLASAVIARTAAPEIILLSLDQRIRASGRALGFGLLPTPSQA